MKHLLLFTLAGTIIVGGCGKKSQEKTIEKAIESKTGKDADVDISDKKIEIETDEGKMSMSTGDGAKIPSDFPKDIYIPDGVKVEMAIQTEKGYSIALSTNQPRSKVTTMYKKQMEASGWTSKTTMDMGNQFMLAYGKGKRIATIIIVGDNKSTRMNITASISQ